MKIIDSSGLDDVWKQIPKVLEVYDGLITYEEYLRYLNVDNMYREVIREIKEKT